MHVAFRVDASRAIGTGHVYRCLALAQALATAGVTPCFVTRALGIDVRHIIEQQGGYAVHLLPAPNTSNQPRFGDTKYANWACETSAVDAEQTIDVLSATEFEWVVVDHYAFDAVWHTTVADALGCRIAVIDDLADRAIAADLVIDHNLADDHRAKYADCMASDTPILGGPRYALLRSVYATAPRWQPSETVASVGIFMGGADTANGTLLAWRACREVARFQGEIELVVTSANPHREALGKLINRDPASLISEDLTDLSAFFGRHGLQIGAGGGATWERCCIGAPTLAVRLADNQRAVVSALARCGAVATIEEREVPNEVSIGHAVSQLLTSFQQRSALSERARALVDGNGAQRVALWMAKQALRVRPAMVADARLLHQWRNDPVTRVVSASDAPIGYAEHLTWIKDTIADKSRCLLVGAVGDQPVGVIRFDQDASTENVSVSLYLAPLLHGLGLGGYLLRAGQDYWQRHRHGGRAFIATVLQSNEASRKMFASAGYRCADGQWVRPIRQTSEEHQ